MEEEQKSIKKTYLKRKNLFIASAIIILTITFISMLFWFRYLRPEESRFTDSNNIDVGFEDLFDESEDVLLTSQSLFENCIVAENIEDYQKRKSNAITGEVKIPESPDYLQFPVELNIVQIRNNFEQITYDTFFKFDNYYCELTDVNWNTLVSPLELEDVLDYIKLRKIDLSASEKDMKDIIIANEDDYNKHVNFINEDNVNAESKVTSVEEMIDRYNINLIKYNPDTGVIEESEIEILKNGTIL